MAALVKQVSLLTFLARTSVPFIKVGFVDPISPDSPPGGQRPKSPMRSRIRCGGLLFSFLGSQGPTTSLLTDCD